MRTPTSCPTTSFRPGPARSSWASATTGSGKKLCEFLGHPDMASEPRFATNAERFRHRDELRALLEAQLQEVDGEQLCRDLLAAGIPAGAVRAIPMYSALI
eukprot:Opistho-2@17150